MTFDRTIGIPCVCNAWLKDPSYERERIQRMAHSREARARGVCGMMCAKGGKS